MKINNLSAVPPNPEISEQKVLQIFFVKEKFNERWQDAKFSSEFLRSSSFTIYQYNILQLAVFFKHFEAIEVIHKDLEVFQHLVESAESSSDSIAYLSMIRPSISLLRFFFDKVRFVNPMNKRDFESDSCVFWHIYSKEFISSLWNFFQEKKNSSDFGPDLQQENIQRLAEFFDQIQKKEIPSHHPLKSYFETTNFLSLNSSSKSAANQKPNNLVFIKDQFGFSALDTSKENLVKG